MARCSDLPPELIALIISFHCGSKLHLRQYSLVCRAWLSPSQRRLFYAFQMFNLVKQVVPFRDFLLGAPHLGAYVREITLIGPFFFNIISTLSTEVIDFAADATDRENIENLFSLLPNITKIRAKYLASSPFLFKGSLLRQCPKLRKFSIVFSVRLADVVSPTAILPVFGDTTVKRIDLRSMKMPSTIDCPLNPVDTKVCSVERLTLTSPLDFSEWFPYFRHILPNWSELKALCDTEDIQLWSDVLRATDLSHLRRLHLSVSIYLAPTRTAQQFPHNDATPLVSCAPNLDHLLLITEVTWVFGDNLSLEVILSMVEWYLCTLAALSRAKDSTLKELSLTVMALDEPPVAAAWEKVDNILSTEAFSTFKHVHFFDEEKNPIKTWSNPNTATTLKQVLPKLARAGKLSV